MTVVILNVRLKPHLSATTAQEIAEHYADLIRESGWDTGEVQTVTYEVRS